MLHASSHEEGAWERALRSLNPVRAGIMAHPQDYLWSSYHTHADGATAPLLIAQALYLALGASAAGRLSRVVRGAPERGDADVDTKRD